MTTDSTQTAAETPIRSEDLLCGMESVSRDGNCNRPATHIWTHRDGQTPVCDRCVISVWLCGGPLTEITHNAPDQARLQPSPEAGCSACFWNEGGRCYDEPCDRLPDGRSKKMADARCAHYITKREKMSRVIPGDMLVITSEQNVTGEADLPTKGDA